MGGVGSAKSNKSFEEVFVAGLDAAGAELDAKLRSPKSFDDNGSAFVGKACGGFELVEGFGAILGPVSKKPPPLNEGKVTAGAADDR